ncbi:uncharacterized protein LOC126942749 [Macaca thibetana thibetana]|uniref:uncharacterized protein LOC126942749 n=1 Tax=Macaca thibetana thibetana TaxID=257877 RepID=UPI0021BC84F6|nr:uncharacterized protein LOC126942749 [Macaca thibetana thibetana]
MGVSVTSVVSEIQSGYVSLVVTYICARRPLSGPALPSWEAPGPWGSGVVRRPRFYGRRLSPVPAEEVTRRPGFRWRRLSPVLWEEVVRRPRFRRRRLRGAPGSGGGGCEASPVLVEEVVPGSGGGGYEAPRVPVEEVVPGSMGGGCEASPVLAEEVACVAHTASGSLCQRAHPAALGALGTPTLRVVCGLHSLSVQPQVCLLTGGPWGPALLPPTARHWGRRKRGFAGCPQRPSKEGLCAAPETFSSRLRILRMLGVCATACGP